MSKTINVAVEIDDSGTAKSLLETLAGFPLINLVQGGQGAPGSAGKKQTANPEVVILHDEAAAGPLFSRLSHWRSNCPETPIFVISPDCRPEHIVEVMKAGVAEYFVPPLDPGLFQGALDKVRTQLGRIDRAGRAKIYSFISSKGGLGATVIAVNLAATLAGCRGQSVALWDMSFRSGDASVLLDLAPDSTISDVCRNFHRLDQSLLGGIVRRHSSGLDFLAAPVYPEQCEEVKLDHVERLISLFKKGYDQVVVDCPSMSIDERTLEALRHSEKVFVITDLSVPGIRNAARLSDLLTKMGISAATIEIAVNRFLKGGTLDIEEAEKTLGKRIFWLFPNEFIDIISSINRGVPLVKYLPGSPFSKNLAGFVEKLKNPGFTKDFRGIRGAFGKSL